MSRNSEYSFSMVPSANIQRSRFKQKHGHKTTFNTGDLIPVYVTEVLPADTISMDMASVVRMTTPVYPVMDNAYLDCYFFYVPSRILWDGFKNFVGENTTTFWTQPTEKIIPTLQSPTDGGFAKGTIADYMGIPIGVPDLKVNHMPFRAYCMIWNEWFRNQNVNQPVNVAKGDGNLTGANLGDPVINAQLGALPLKVSKFHDYFTAALPSPQKGAPVQIPLGTNAKVGVGTTSHNYGDQTGLYWRQSNGGNIPTGNFNMEIAGSGASGNSMYTDQGVGGGVSIKPINLYADLSTATAATVNQLRQAFQVQKLLEKDARGGTRMTEMIRTHFGVISPDSRQQRPEYLGGYRQTIGMDQVLQTSQTTEDSPQGNTAAYSMTSGSRSLFTKSFTEPGYVIGLVCVRTDHTYQQGIQRFWTRSRRFDFYYPSLAHIGEQAILNKEIYAVGSATPGQDDQAFGYQEAWADYRYSPSRTSGAMRSTYAQPLDAWHYGDKYTALPTLSSTWMVEPVTNVDRTLAVQSTVEDQFIADFLFDGTFVRPMPLYSIPGLIDHF